MNKEIILVCKSVRYYSPFDEEAFFEWIHKISCIKNISGRGDELYLHVKRGYIRNKDLYGLLGLFYRYKIDMKSLKVFLNKNNKKWFYDNKKAYWYKGVFGHTE